MTFEINTLVGKTIKSVHKNKGYILKFTDNSTLNMMAVIENDIPIIRFHPPINKNSIINNDLSDIAKTIRRINGIPTKEDLK